ncbi:solid-state culture-specific protein-like protein [Lepidopterella palustris CBS 459.81]|uniref:Solid-state culture-specific protein-like protein n=1 Tax=Lepidopterella palustris CBS 459.81 TaxID=1314670 RepID=A0A8E2EHR0_9PEZI|nr:solid-state culture-specific protein-like protein [Lepidopterella palustris CBS 459.81]
MASISLDTTLRDLYAKEGREDHDVILCYAVPTAEVQMAPGIPLSKKFIYQSPLCPTTDSSTLAREFLKLVSVNSSRLRQYQHDAYAVFQRLDPTQRPNLSFVTKPADIEITPGYKFATVNPMDCLAPLPQLVPPEGHYEVLSKCRLALSGLLTPNTVLIDTVLSPARLQVAGAVDTDAEHMLGVVAARPLPFVVKLPQSLSGQGTFPVRTASDRTRALVLLGRETRRMLNAVTPENAHLKPCCLVLQDMLPGEAVALSLFVTRSGTAVFNACCGQLVDAHGAWGGGLIDYAAQDVLAASYAGLASRLACYVRSLGYWGPMGADIMTDGEGRQLVVDMNVRETGSHPLGVLRGHFQRRGLNVALTLFALMIRGTRDEFKAAFEEEVGDGSLVVNAWVHMRDGKTSMMTITLGAEDKDVLDRFVGRVNEWKAVKTNWGQHN